MYINHRTITSIMVILLVIDQLKTSGATQNCLKNSHTVNVTSSDQPYNLWTEIRPDILYSSDCTQVNFVSTDSNSNVCLQQINGRSQINDSNVILKGFDGHKEILSLEYFPSVWQYGEICSKTSTLTFQLKKLNNKLLYRPEQLYFNFRVVHIESLFRKLYMDDLFCDGTYTLRNSTVEILSHNTLTSKATAMCGLNIEKPVKYRNMCLYYSLKPHIDRYNSWNMYVSTVKYSLKAKDHVFTFNGNSSKTGAWCGNEAYAMLIIQRDSVSEIVQDHREFVMLLTDFNGTKEQFLDFINSSNYGVSPTPRSEKSDADSACLVCAPIIIPLVILIIIVILVAVFMWLLIRHLCHKVTKRTAFSSTFQQSKSKFTKSDIQIVSNKVENSSLLHNL